MSRPPKTQAQAEQDFWKRVTKGDGCWLWIGARDKWGYGYVTAMGSFGLPRIAKAHRAAWTMVNGKIPEGMQLDHFACDNPPCVRPDHLRPVTGWENTLRSAGVTSLNRAKTHCVKGHEFTAENTYRVPSRPEYRECWACKRARRVQRSRATQKNL